MPFFIGQANAQIQPGTLPTREQIETPPPAPPPAALGARVRDERVQEPCAFESSNLQADISRVRFESYGGGALPPAIAALIGRATIAPGRQPVSNLCRIRDEAAGRLREAGYIASVVIPPQEITGEAVLQVVLARLVDVQVSGSAGRYRGTLDARIARLKAIDPFNVREAERVLLLANDVPGLEVAMTIRSAGTRPGEVIGELKVGYSPFLLIGNVQNTGSRAIGRESASVRAEFYGLTGASDRTYVGASSTLDFEEQQSVQLGHSFGLASGFTFGPSFAYAWSRPDVGALDLRSRSLVASIDAAAPIVRSLRQNLNIGGGFELIEQRVRLGRGGNAFPLTRDKLRVAYLRLGGGLKEPATADRQGSALGGSVELRQGLDIWNATRPATITATGYAPSRFEGEADATVIRGGLWTELGLTSAFSLGTQLQGQWASDPLLSFEEYSVGNLTIGRGYDPGITAGDRAIAARIEPRLTLPLSPRVGVQAFGFYDVVRIWNLDSITTEKERTLRSWGGGARFFLPGRLALDAMYAHPVDPELNLPGARRASDRFILSLTIQYGPRGR